MIYGELVSKVSHGHNFHIGIINPICENCTRGNIHIKQYTSDYNSVSCSSTEKIYRFILYSLTQACFYIIFGIAYKPEVKSVGKILKNIRAYESRKRRTKVYIFETQT